MFILCFYLRCKVTKTEFGIVGFCRFLSVFVSFCRFSERCFFSLQSYEKGFCHCQFVSVYVTLCHFMSLSDLLPLSRFYITRVLYLVKMASSLASIAETWPENVLPQWQQKIALRAENNCSSVFWYIWGRRSFSAHLRNFLQVLDLLIFRQKQSGHWAEVVCHFHLLVLLSFVISRFCFRSD